MAANEHKITAAGGLVIPKLASAPSSPSDGAIWYNTGSGQFEQRAGGSTVSSLTNPMTTAGDIIVGGSGGSPTRLALGASNTVATSDGSTVVYALLANANIATGAAIAYSKLNLSGSIVNADVNASAAIAYSKLNLSTSIVNADISASAAIAYSKLATLTASRVLVSDGSGIVSVSSRTSTEVDYLINAYNIAAATLTGGATSTALASLTFAHGTFNGVHVDYTVRDTSSGALRTGRLLIVSDGTLTSITENSTETADPGVVWDLNVSGGNTQVRYTTTANNKTFNAAVRRFAV